MCIRDRAVVGGVIGTIWVSAAKMIEDYKITQLTNGLILGANNLIKNISSADMGAMPRNVNGYYHLTNYCIVAKIFPESFYGNNKLFTPFYGDDFSVAQQNNGDIRCEANGPYIEIDFVVPTKGICLKMTNAITKRFHNRTMLDNIVVSDYNGDAVGGSWSGTNYTTWPLPLSGTHCDAVYPANIRLRFNPQRVSN